ncbi:MAG: hypothetical protein PHN74_02925 [Candidatus Pacebacteria bacterium]|nr:hypothetical protein [Candidatus Paceibacterota bacterium]
MFRFSNKTLSIFILFTAIVVSFAIVQNSAKAISCSVYQDYMTQYPNYPYTGTIGNMTGCLCGSTSVTSCDSYDPQTNNTTQKIVNYFSGSSVGIGGKCNYGQYSGYTCTKTGYTKIVWDQWGCTLEGNANCSDWGSATYSNWSQELWDACKLRCEAAAEEEAHRVLKRVDENMDKLGPYMENVVYKCSCYFNDAVSGGSCCTNPCIGLIVTIGCCETKMCGSTKGYNRCSCGGSEIEVGSLCVVNDGKYKLICSSTGYQEYWERTEDVDPPAASVCGDHVCNSILEDSMSCPEDCGAAPTYCGDGTCNPDESCANCHLDCGSCATAACGDGYCGSSEDCNSCATDCGRCVSDDSSTGSCQCGSRSIGVGNICLECGSSYGLICLSNNDYGYGSATQCPEEIEKSAGIARQGWADSEKAQRELELAKWRAAQDAELRRLEAMKKQLEEERLRALQRRSVTSQVSESALQKAVKDQEKINLIKSIEKKLAQINDKMVDQWSGALMQLSRITNGIGSRLEKAAAAGENITAAKTAAEKATSSINIAYQKVVIQSGKDYLVNATSVSTVKSAALTTRTKLNKDLKALEVFVKTAYDDTSAAFEALKTVSNLGEE